MGTTGEVEVLVITSQMWSFMSMAIGDEDIMVTMVIMGVAITEVVTTAEHISHISFD